MNSIATAIGAWVLTYLLHSTILLASVVAALQVGRRRLERLAEPFWYVALLGAVLSATVRLSVAPAQAASLLSGVHGGTNASVPLPHWVASVSATMLGDLLPVLGAGWALVALVRLLALLRSLRSLRCLLADRTPIRDQHVGARVRELCDNEGIRVSSSRRIVTPMVVGLRELCIPECALALPASQLDAVLAHECAHIARRDAGWLLLAVMAERVLFVQPLNRLALARLRMLAECACDDWAIARTHDVLALAEALAWGAKRLLASHSLRLAVGMASHESAAVARVRRMLEPGVVRDPPLPVAARLAMAAVVLPVVVLLAPGVSLASSPRAVRYTVHARDNAGPFTLTIEGGRVLAMTMDGERVPGEHMQQRDNHLHVTGVGGGAPLDITLQPMGGLRWSSRPFRPASPLDIH